MSIVDLPNVENNENIAALEAMKRNLPILLEYASLQAQLKRAKFLALVKEGFSEQQAIELVKA